MKITGREVRDIGWMINTSQLNSCRRCLPSSRMLPNVIVQQDNTGTKHTEPLILNGPSQFLHCFAVMLIIHRLISGQEVDEENAPSLPEHCANYFPHRQNLLEFRLAERSTLTLMHWLLMVSGVMCATHVSSPVMIWSRNSLPSSWYCYRNVNADSMRFSLRSGVICFVTYLAYNFLNNRCSVTILCNKEQEMFYNCETTILHNAFPTTPQGHQ